MKKSREVLQFSAHSNRFIRKWSGVKEASEQLNIRPSNIYKAMNGDYKQAGGYVWMRLSDYEQRTTIFK